MFNLQCKLNFNSIDIETIFTNTTDDITTLSTIYDKMMVDILTGSLRIFHVLLIMQILFENK